MTNLTVRQMVAQGLCEMFNGLNYMGHLDKQAQHVTKLEQHPFGLAIPDDLARKDIRFLGFPGYTDESVEAMISHIRWFVAGGTWRTAEPQYLRVINAEASFSDPLRHMVYYEIGSPYGVLMCGGCTDHSGAGGVGKFQLDSVFALLSLLFEIEIDSVVINFEDAQRMEQELRDAYEEYRK